MHRLLTRKAAFLSTEYSCLWPSRSSNGTWSHQIIEPCGSTLTLKNFWTHFSSHTHSEDKKTKMYWPMHHEQIQCEVPKICHNSEATFPCLSAPNGVSIYPVPKPSARIWSTQLYQDGRNSFCRTKMPKFYPGRVEWSPTIMRALDCLRYWKLLFKKSGHVVS